MSRDVRKLKESVGRACEAVDARLSMTETDRLKLASTYSVLGQRVHEATREWPHYASDEHHARMIANVVQSWVAKLDVERVRLRAWRVTR